MSKNPKFHDDCPTCGDLHAALAAAEELLRRCVIELVYVNEGVEGCNTGLCATSEGMKCIQLAEELLGPVRNWPEIKAGREKDENA